MGWLLYCWDLNGGSGQARVKAVVLGLKDLSPAGVAQRAADVGKSGWRDTRICWMLPLGSGAILPDLSLYFFNRSAGQRINCLLAGPSLKQKRIKTDSGVALGGM